MGGRWKWRSGTCSGAKIGDFGSKTRDFLRDEIALGRGVHRKMGVRIQKSRSKFGLKVGKSREIGKLGVGVV